MNFYVVEIKIRVGDYEKNVISLRQAESPDKAGELALLGQCHGSAEDGTMEWTESGIADLNWEFHYSVQGCTLVPANEVPTLRKYL